MGRIADRFKPGHGHRTGQTMMSPSPVRQNGSGPCGPAAPAVPMSWGAACPPGGCTGAELAAALGRAFAGERYPCRELPYTVRGTTDGGGDLTLSQNSLVTICPTRVMISQDDGVVVPANASLVSFTIGSQNQVLGDPIPASHLSPFSYQIIPFVGDCMRSGMPFELVLEDFAADSTVYVTFIGPAVG